MASIGAADPESTVKRHHDLRRAAVTGCLQGAFKGLTLQSVARVPCWSDLGKVDAARTAEQVKQFARVGPLRHQTRAPRFGQPAWRCVRLRFEAARRSECEPCEPQTDDH